MTMNVSRRKLVFAGAAAMACSCQHRGKEDAVSATHDEIGEFLESRNEALRRKDIDRLMSFYAPDVVYFDLVPPLRYIGAAALRSRFTDWFDGWQSDVGQEVRDLTILASDAVIAAHMLIRASGTRKNGQQVSFGFARRIFADVRVSDGSSRTSTFRCPSI